MPKPRRRRRFFALGEERYATEVPGVTRSAPDSGSAEPISEGEWEMPPDFDSTGPEDTDEVFTEDIPIGGDAAFRVKPPRARRPDYRHRVPAIWVLVISLVSMVFGGLVAYFLPKPTPKVVKISEAKAPVLLSQIDQDALDAAYDARRRGKLAEAEQLFASLAREHPAWPGMNVEVGRTLLYAQNYLGARAALNAAVGGGLVSVEATRLIGVAFDAEKSYAEAEQSFTQAAILDPTQADTYFLWAECLRGQGKITDAIAKYRSALLRNEDETGAGLYRLKLWLCQIEASQGTDATVNAEIDAALARPLPSMEAFFAVAARELVTGNLRAAAAHLLRARERADPQIFLAVLNDPFFVQVRSRPELAEMIRSLPSEPSATSTPSTLPGVPLEKKQ